MAETHKSSRVPFTCCQVGRNSAACVSLSVCSIVKERVLRNSETTKLALAEASPTVRGDWKVPEEPEAEASVRPGEAQKKPKTGDRVNGNFEIFSEGRILANQQIDSKRKFRCRTVEPGLWRRARRPGSSATRCGRAGRGAEPHWTKLSVTFPNCEPPTQNPTRTCTARSFRHEVRAR